MEKPQILLSTQLGITRSDPEVGTGQADLNARNYIIFSLLKKRLRIIQVPNF